MAHRVRDTKERVSNVVESGKEFTGQAQDFVASKAI
jgi:hypothetical protein